MESWLVALLGTELERLRTENAGTDRACCKASKITFEEDKEEALLRITYKVGRKTKKETAPLISDWEQVKEELIEECMEDSEDIEYDYWDEFCNSGEMIKGGDIEVYYEDIGEEDSRMYFYIVE